MKRKRAAGLILLLLLTVLAGAALAADGIRFEEKSLQIFEGSSAQPVLIREGAAAEEGEPVFTSSKNSVVSVAADGTLSALKKGEAVIRATLTSGKKKWTATLSVKVLRAVTKVTLDTTKLRVYDPTDPRISGLLNEEPEGNVILTAAGKSFKLAAVCTPPDASGKRVLFSSSDEGVLSVSGDTAKARQAGECMLTATSEQNPEVQEFWHVLVTQPVAKLTVETPEGRTVAAGGTLQLTAGFEPDNVTLREVEWSSRNPKVATVDQNGVVTGVKKGTTVIEAKALDGSGKKASVTVVVAQKPTGIAVRETSLMLATRQQGYLHASVQPQEANDRGLTFTSTDPSVATVTPSGQVRGVKRGECEIIIAAKADPNVSVSVPVQVIQKVEKIVFTGTPVSLPVRTTAQLSWEVQPADATIQDVTFSSSNRKVATVDQNGVVTGLVRGTSTITATATDGSGRRGQVRVTVTQPVEGVAIQYPVYHVQLEGSMNVKALIYPSNANNLNVHFTTGDDYIATVTDKRNIGHVRGWHRGTTTITGVTEDGGFTASAEIRVDDFNRAVVVDDIYLENENIRMVFRNRSDFTVDRVNFIVETWDRYGNPLVCNSDGVSNWFEGSYRLELYPGDRTEHYCFNFGNYVQPIDKIGTVQVTIISWRDSEAYTRTIPESERPSQSFSRFFPPTPVPPPTPTPVPTPEPTAVPTFAP